jgi:drug/metabolite transporter (DMT)-like permease
MFSFSERSKSRSIARALPYLILAIAPLCWSGNIVLARGINHLISPVSLAFWRWTVAFFILLPFAWRYALNDWDVVIRQWKVLLFLSLTGITCFNTLLYAAMHTTTAINGALIQTSMPAVIILISLIAFKESVTKKQLTGVVMCIFGAGFVVLRGDFSAFFKLDFAEGDILMMVAVVIYALYSAFLRQRPPIHPMSFLIYTFGIGAFGLLPLFLWQVSESGPIVLNADIVASILYVAVFPSIIAYLCWNHGIAVLGANRGGLFINLIPVFASLLAITWLGESLEFFHLIGMTLICGGMVLFNH